MVTRQLVVRLPTDLAGDLARMSGRVGKARSELVREALRAFLQTDPRRRGRPADRVRHLIGCLESGIPHLAEFHRRYVLESIRRGR